MTLNPGMTPDHVLALFHVATGALPHDDATLGRITLALGRRSATRLDRLRAPTPAEGVPAVPASPEPPVASASLPPAPPIPTAPPPTYPAPPPQSLAAVPAAPSAEALLASRRASAAFRPDVLPVDVEVKRAVAGLRTATTPEEQRVAVEKLHALAEQLIALHDVAIVADAIAALDRLLPTVQDPGVLGAIDKAALALSDRALVERLVHRLGESRVPTHELESVVTAVGALASVSMGLVIDAFVAAPAELRAPYRATIRAAADRAIEPLQGKLADAEPTVVAAAAEFLGVTGSPQAVSLLLPLLRHTSEYVREAALHHRIIYREKSAGVAKRQLVSLN